MEVMRMPRAPRARTEDSRPGPGPRSEEHTSELQSPCNLVCRLLLEKKNITFLMMKSIEGQSLDVAKVPPGIRVVGHSMLDDLEYPHGAVGCDRAATMHEWKGRLYPR